MKRIVFQSNQLSVRGTEIALYDYAYHNQTILGNQSIIAYQRDHGANDQSVIDKFSSHFDMIPYDKISNLDHLIDQCKGDLLYAIKAGEPDGVISLSVPTMVHAVFPQSPMNAHGSSYAFVSDWLSKVCSNGVIPAVPHMVTLPSCHEDLRQELGIPAHATVFGGYGGANSFDLDFAKQVVRDIVNKRSDIYFIFMNIQSFLSHPRVMFLASSANLEYKVKFINTCDAMLHARKLGESFGLACAEFSIKNKPIFTYSKSLQRHHIDVLGPKGFFYSGYKSLWDSLMSFDRIYSQSQDWDCYSQKFSPSNVMNLFDQHLIQESIKNGVTLKPAINYGWQDKFACKLEAIKLKEIKLSRIWAK